MAMSKYEDIIGFLFAYNGNQLALYMCCVLHHKSNENAIPSIPQYPATYLGTGYQISLSRLAQHLKGNYHSLIRYQSASLKALQMISSLNCLDDIPMFHSSFDKLPKSLGSHLFLVALSAG